MSLDRPTHESVLLDEAVNHLVWDPNGLYLDATVGLGGHSEAILKKLSAQGQLLGLDMDPETLIEAERRLKSTSTQFRLLQANFRTLGQVLESQRFFPLAGALFDLGVSSWQLEKASRGFSFSRSGPLDMRMSPDNPLTAETIVNRWPQEQLELLLREYGEEPASQSIAHAICSRRAQKPFKTTTELASLIEGRNPRGRIHPATKTFMALRIAVNTELENLLQALQGILPYLRQGGLIGVISFHSLEDRIVKNLFASFVEQKACRYYKDRKSPIRPQSAEINKNPRARSAKMRILEKI